VATRIFLTVWLVYALHFASDIVRETYLAKSLGDRLSIRVDEYVGLHPDLFEIEGRGVFITNNPGASMLGAVPYVMARPIIRAILSARPELSTPKPAAAYDDPRPNRVQFLNEVRSRGLDVELGLAAASMQAGLMAPLGGLAAAILFIFLVQRGYRSRLAVWLALLYAFGTPIFFRSAFLNQNALLTHFVLLAFVALAWPERKEAGQTSDALRLVLAGALLGAGLLCDYSGVPFLLVFGAWVVVRGWRGGGASGAVVRLGMFALGAAGPVVILLAYQWRAFGHPLWPAQSYMPATEFSTRGWFGVSPPAPELLWRNLFDLRYGLFAFCPMLLLAMFAPFVRKDEVDEVAAVTGLETAVIFASFVGLYLFSSANQYAHLQWNTGVRYMVPAAPLLFVAMLPALRRIGQRSALFIAMGTLAISWSVAMVRLDVPTSLAHVFLRGFELPWLTVLQKTASAYAPFLEKGASPLAIFVLLGCLMWLLWRDAPFHVEPEETSAGSMGVG